jgi:polysaccharide export outer membrane protein
VPGKLRDPAALGSYGPSREGVSAFAHQSGKLRKHMPIEARLRRLLLQALLIGMLSCWQIGFASATETQEAPTYLIGPGDELQITVWAEPELSTSTTVRPDGRISVPLVEDLPAAGKTPSEVADAIEDRLSEYRTDPLVTVMVVSGLGDLKQQIRVVGEAGAPKAIAYRSGMTLLDAIVVAGGLSREADGNGAVIVRQQDGVTREIPVRLSDLVEEGDSTANVAMQPSDVIVIPEAFFEGEWLVTYSATASETFSDNIDQEPDGEREAGFITRAGPSIFITGSSARVVGAFSGNLIGVYQAGGEDEGFSLDPAIRGTSTTELSPDHVFFDLSGSVRRRLLNARESTSGSGASTSNRDLVAVFTASPYLVHQLGDFADAEWRYRFSPIFVDASDRSDTLSHEASVILDSGEDFSSFGWTFSNFARLEDRSREGDIKSANTDLGLRYSLWHGFTLLGGIGYEYRSGDENDEDNFEGVTWRGGFRYEPHPDLSLEATYGHRNDDDSLDASLDYQIGPNTTLTASYAEALETGQGRAESNLREIIIDPDTGEPVVDEDDPFTFEDETTRTRTLRVGATHFDDNNTFGLFALKGDSEGGSEGDEDFYQARVTWSRALSEELSFIAAASYEHSKFDEDDRTDDTYFFNTSLGYTLSGHARAFMSYSFEMRDSTDEDESFTENTVTVGVTTSY